MREHINPKSVKELLDEVEIGELCIQSFWSIYNIPKDEKRARNKLKKLQPKFKEQLAERIERYEEILDRGANALSEYDVSSNGCYDAVQTAFLLIPNQIQNNASHIMVCMWGTKQTEEQSTLF